MNIVQILILAISLLLVLAAVIWGIKHYKRLKYDRIKMRVKYKKPSDDEEEYEEDFRSELPSGGARVVAHRDPDDIETVNSRIRDQAEANKPKLSISLGSPEQGALDLGLDIDLDEEDESDPHIPVLLDPAEVDQDEVDTAEKLDESKPISDSESIDDLVEASVEQPLVSESTVGLDIEADQEEAEVDSVPVSLDESLERPETETIEPLKAETLDTAQEQELQSFQEEHQEKHQEKGLSQEESDKPDHSILFSEPETTEKHSGGYLPDYEVAETAHSNSQVDSSNEDEQLDAQNQTQVEPEAELKAELESEPEPVKDEVIIINLMCTDQGDEFQGSELSAALESQGLVHGNMDIFHYESGNGADTVRFSVANILNPGTFPRDKLEYFYTPGVCFFMTLTPGVSNLQAFNKLLSVARGVTSRIGGELKDESRQYLTHQRIEEIRTRMGEFQRENLLG